MNHLRIQPLDEKRVRLSGIDPFLAACLQELPEVLSQCDHPSARQRLFPDPTAHDEEVNADWHRLMEPDLRHLFVSAAETMARDLTSLEPDASETDCLQVAFPAAHVSAWMSALNQARLILGELHRVEERDMASAQFDLREPKHLAVLKIHLLGYLLQLFVELESGESRTAG